jgi:hypothetical protein
MGCLILFIALMLVQSFITISVFLQRVTTAKRREVFVKSPLNSVVVAAIASSGMDNESEQVPTSSNTYDVSYATDSDTERRDGVNVPLSNVSGKLTLTFNKTAFKYSERFGKSYLNHSSSNNREPDLDQIEIEEIIVSVHVIAFSRPKSLSTLLIQLGEADYRTKSASSVDLYIRIDGGGPQEVVDVANQFEWMFGQKHVMHSEISSGLRGMWTSIRPQTEKEVMIIFEDDLRVSPFYFAWTMHLLRAYGGNGRKVRDPSLLGFSLSPLKMDEISYPFVDWNVLKNTNKNVHLYLHSVPSSWGSVFFADRWIEFLKFYKTRMEPQFYNTSDESRRMPGVAVPLGDQNLLIPNSRTNVWPGSWKRVLVEFCYGRVMYTLYTHIPGRFGFASPLQLTGAHSTAAKIPSDSADHSPSREMLKNHRVVRVLNDKNVMDNLLRRECVRVEYMVLFDLWGRPTTKLRLAVEANMFLNRILTTDQTKYKGLVGLWSRDRSAVTTWIDFENQRYLIYQPQFGFSNQQIALKNAAYWATCLNRTLVVPPIFVPRVSEAKILSAADLVYFDEIFRFDHVHVNYCSAMLRTESLTTFSRRGIHPVLVYDIHPNMTGDELSDVFFNDIIPWSSIPRRKFKLDMCSESMSARKLQRHFGHIKDSVLAFNGMYKCSMIDSRAKSEAFRLALFRPSPLFLSIRREVFGALRVLGLGFQMEAECLCVQLRLGDFESVCNLNTPWLSKKRKTGNTCLPSAANVSAAVARWQGPCVAVMTNDEARASGMLNHTNKTLILPSAVRAAISSLGLDRGLGSPSGQHLLTILLEQLLCERSAWAVLNYYSTFGETVSLLRKGGSKSSVWW